MEKGIKGFVRDLVSLEKKPVRGLLVVEWVVMAYLALTLLLILFLYTKLPEANLLVMGTAFFKAADPAAVGRQIKELA